MDAPSPIMRVRLMLGGETVLEAESDGQQLRTLTEHGATAVFDPRVVGETIDESEQRRRHAGNPEAASDLERDG